MWVKVQRSVSEVTSRLVGHGDQLTVDQVPDDFKEPFIYTGYRKLHKNWGYYWDSLLVLHNETLNVWSHAGGCVVVFLALLDLIRHFDLDKDKVAWPILVFGAGCVFELFLSATAHLFHSKSIWHHYIFFLLDYAGITIFMFGTGVGSMFICSSQAFHDQYLDWSLPSLVLSSWFALVTCCMARFNVTHEKTKSHRMMVTGIALSSVVVGLPTASRYVECFNDPTCKLASMNHISTVFGLIFLAGAIFAAHAPERWFPGCFDLIGHSHQIFHVVVVFLMLAQCRAIYIDALVLKVSHHVDPNPWTICAAFICLILMEGVTLLYFIQRKVKAADENDNCFSTMNGKLN